MDYDCTRRENCCIVVITVMVPVMLLIEDEMYHFPNVRFSVAQIIIYYHGDCDCEIINDLQMMINMAVHVT